MQKKSSEIMKRHNEIALLFDLPTSTSVTTIPSLPSLFTLMEDEPSVTSPKREQGLFAAILQNDPTALYQDMRQDPEKYDSNAVELVEELIAKRRKPTAEERRLLDAAVLELNSVPPPKTTPKKLVPKPALQPKEEASEGVPLAGVDFPAGLERPFWWL